MFGTSTAFCALSLNARIAARRGMVRHGDKCGISLGGFSKVLNARLSCRSGFEFTKPWRLTYAEPCRACFCRCILASPPLSQPNWRQPPSRSLASVRVRARGQVVQIGSQRGMKESNAIYQPYFAQLSQRGFIELFPYSFNNSNSPQSNLDIGIGKCPVFKAHNLCGISGARKRGNDFCQCARSHCLCRADDKEINQEEEETPVVVVVTADWQTKRDTNNDHAMRGGRESEGEWGCKCYKKIAQSWSTLRAAGAAASSDLQGGTIAMALLAWLALASYTAPRNRP